MPGPEIRPHFGRWPSPPGRSDRLDVDHSLVPSRGALGPPFCPQVHTTCGGRCCWRLVISLRPQGRRSVCLVITASAGWGWQEVSGDRWTEPGDPGHTGCAGPLPVGTASQTETGWRSLSLRASPKSTCQARAAGGNSCGTEEMPELRLYSFLKASGVSSTQRPLIARSQLVGSWGGQNTGPQTRVGGGEHGATGLYS